MMAPTLRRGSKPVTLCVTAQRATVRGGRWSVKGCIPTQSVGTIMKGEGMPSPESLQC
ncbi:conserved hypothetical protein [Pseudomonas sp. 8O]|nr:conserved hypothetical protein [Pseudomonas sp. 8O]